MHKNVYKAISYLAQQTDKDFLGGGVDKTNLSTTIREFPFCFQIKGKCISIHF